MNKKPKNLCSSVSQRGFTLLEVLIALAILSIGLLGLASLTASVIRTNDFSDDFTTATALAQDKLEDLANTSYDLLSDNSDTVDADGSSNSSGKYGRDWDITDNISTKAIEVTVSWTSMQSISKSISFSTIRNNSQS